MNKDTQILSIEELKQMAKQIVAIPNFSNEGTINVRLQRPRLMSMASQGQIPNHLIGIATEAVGGKKPKNKIDDADKMKDAALLMELYCSACLVEPAYEEFKDIMTDQQSDYIFRWAMGEVGSLNSFREEDGNSTNDNTSKEV